MSAEQNSLGKPYEFYRVFTWFTVCFTARAGLGEKSPEKQKIAKVDFSETTLYLGATVAEMCREWLIAEWNILSTSFEHNFTLRTPAGELYHFSRKKFAKIYKKIYKNSRSNKMKI